MEYGCLALRLLEVLPGFALKPAWKSECGRHSSAPELLMQPEHVQRFPFCAVSLKLAAWSFGGDLAEHICNLIVVLVTKIQVMIEILIVAVVMVTIIVVMVVMIVMIVMIVMVMTVMIVIMCRLSAMPSRGHRLHLAGWKLPFLWTGR